MKWLSPKLWCLHCWIGLTRHAEPTIQYDTRYSAHDTIHSAIHFNDLPLLAEKQRLAIRSTALLMPPTGCAVMMCSSYNNGGLLRVFQVQCIWAKFTGFNWIYWLLMWYFLFLSNFGICYKCTVSYHYLLLRIAIHIGAPVSAVYRCAGVSFQPYCWRHHSLDLSHWYNLQITTQIEGVPAVCSLRYTTASIPLWF